MNLRIAVKQFSIVRLSVVARVAKKAERQM